MKKIFSTLVIMACLLLAVPAQAQVKFGLKGGLDVSKLDNKVGDNTTGFFVGPMVDVTLPIIGLGIDVAALYSQSGAAGPQFGFSINDGWKQLMEESNKSFVSVNVGAGLKLLRHLQVGVNYNIGASKLGDMIVESSDGNLRSSIRKNSWQVSLAYMF